MDGAAQQLQGAPPLLPAAGQHGQQGHANLYVTNLSPEVTETQLRELFASYGSIASMRLIRNSRIPNGWGVAFVRLGSVDEASAAIAALNGAYFGAGAISVAFAHQDAGSGGSARPAREAPPCDNVYLRGVPLSYTDAELTALFAPFGQVQSFRLLVANPESGDTAKAALVRLAAVEQAAAAVAALNGKQLPGAPGPLLAKFAESRESRESRVNSSSPYGRAPGSGMGNGGGGYGPPGSGGKAVRQPSSSRYAPYSLAPAGPGLASSAPSDAMYGAQFGEQYAAQLAQYAVVQQLQQQQQQQQGVVQSQQFASMPQYPGTAAAYGTQLSATGMAQLPVNFAAAGGYQQPQQQMAAAPVGSYPTDPAAAAIAAANVAAVALGVTTQPAPALAAQAPAQAPGGGYLSMPQFAKPTLQFQQPYQQPAAPTYPQAAAPVPYQYGGGQQAAQSGPPLPTSLCIRNLAPEVDDLWLYRHFAPHGAINSVKTMPDDRGACRGIAFVNYKHAGDAAAAQAAEHNLVVRDKDGVERTISVTFQQPRQRTR